MPNGHRNGRRDRDREREREHKREEVAAAIETEEIGGNLMEPLASSPGEALGEGGTTMVLEREAPPAPSLLTTTLVCQPTPQPPGGPGNNWTPIGQAQYDNAGRQSPAWHYWFDNAGQAWACFEGNVVAEGISSTPGLVGPAGPPGPQGNQGNPGQAATITVGSVTASAPGSQPSITNSGSATNTVLNFVLPQGQPGPQGNAGNNGINSIVRGSVANVGALPTSGNNVGDIWVAQDTGNGYSWNGTGWINVGQMRGVPGPIGPVGPAGPSITIKGSVATSSALPTTGNNVNDAWIANDTGDLWIWNGSSWTNAGKITGPAGPAGPTGPTGSQGVNGASATIAVGTVNTLPAGQPATVTNAGTSLAAIFNFGIPQGQTGATGNPGPTGATGATGPAFTPATTGTGTTYVLQTSPNITTPTIGSPTISSPSISGTLTSSGGAIFAGNITQNGSANTLAAQNLTVAGTTALTGASTAPTVAATDSSTNIATTAYVRSQMGQSNIPTVTTNAAVPPNIIIPAGGTTGLGYYAGSQTTFSTSPRATRALIIFNCSTYQQEAAVTMVLRMGIGTGAVPVNSTQASIGAGGLLSVSPSLQFGSGSYPANMQLPSILTWICAVTPSTGYWLDAILSSGTAGAAEVFNIVVQVYELM